MSFRNWAVSWTAPWCAEMGIRKPNLSVKEARQLASVRSSVLSKEAVSDDLDISGQMPTIPADDTRPITGHALATRTAARSDAAKALSDLPNRSPPVPKSKKSETVRGVSTQPASPVFSPPLHSLKHSEKIQVFLSAPVPAEGVSQVYEILRRQHGPHKALQMIMRKALAAYEKMLASGTFQQAVKHYAVDETLSAETIVQTSRMMPKTVVAVARAHFDPLGFESTRAFGRQLGTAALAAFFASERLERHSKSSP